MKHIKHWLATIAMLLCSITASAHDFEVGGIYYSITSAENLTVAVTYRGNKYNQYSNEYTGAVTIPSTVTYNSKTYSVTSIESRAFSSCSSLTSITLPESVTSIGGGAFSGCSSLTSITLPESVTSIGGIAFSGCSSLTSITLPESVTSIGNFAFSGCSSLTSITIPEGVTSIGNSAFRDCSSLTSITLPESVTSIGGIAFSGCSSLTSITSYAVVPPTCYASTFASVDTSIPVYVPEVSVADYQSAEVWKDFFNIFSVETGIEAPEIIDEESETIYDLHGRRVENPGKGIYIMGGKKVVVK